MFLCKYLFKFETANILDTALSHVIYVAAQNNVGRGKHWKLWLAKCSHPKIITALKCNGTATELASFQFKKHKSD